MGISNKKLYIGIDIGVTGALSVFDNLSHNPIEVIRFDKLASIETELPNLLRVICFGVEEVFVCIEKVGYMLGDGPQGAFTFGKSYGIVLGIIGSLGIPRMDVLPVKWKRFYSLIDSSLKYADKKKKAKEKVLQLFPGLEKYPIGIYDSILIGNYCREEFNK
jgi:crossover junction endodeoxyribonuclease RuvC